jgi:Tol biopolymer transport system component
VHALTTDKAEDRYPTFSHDGRSVYFSSNRSGRFEIYKIPVDGGKAVSVMDQPATFAVESDDGRYLYFEYLEGNSGYTGNSPIWRIATDHSEPAVEVLPGWQRIEKSC